jgi:hypothetical protein
MLRPMVRPSLAIGISCYALIEYLNTVLLKFILLSLYIDMN